MMKEYLLWSYIPPKHYVCICVYVGVPVCISVSVCLICPYVLHMCIVHAGIALPS